MNLFGAVQMPSCPKYHSCFHDIGLDQTFQSPQAVGNFVDYILLGLNGPLNALSKAIVAILLPKIAWGPLPESYGILAGASCCRRAFHHPRIQ